MTVTLQSPTADQWSELEALWEASVRASHDFLPETDLQLIRPLLQSHYFAQVELTCAVQNGRIVGFLGCAADKVEMLFVDPACFGQGIGQRLMRHAIDQLGARLVDVNEQNPNALRFYQKMGFVVQHRSPLDGGGRPFPILHLALPATAARPAPPPPAPA